MAGEHEQATKMQGFRKSEGLELEKLRPQQWADIRHQHEQFETLHCFVRGLAHDLNNLLTAIWGNVALAQRPSQTGSSSIAPRLAAAERASLQARDLIQRLLAFSRCRDPRKTRVQAQELIREAVSFLPASGSQACVLSLAEDLGEMVVDRMQISQMLHQLLRNAKEAMPQGGPIRVEGRRVLLKAVPPFAAGEYVKISVQDRGRGLSAPERRRVFEPYFSSKDKSSRRGVGCGLAIAYAIIRKHQGVIFLDSRPGFGSVFHVYLPAG